MNWSCSDLDAQNPYLWVVMIGNRQETNERERYDVLL